MQYLLTCNGVLLSCYMLVFSFRQKFFSTSSTIVQKRCRGSGDCAEGGSNASESEEDKSIHRYIKITNTCRQDAEKLKEQLNIE